MRRNRAEIAASEASAMSIDGILDHIVGRNPLALVARMRHLRERQVPERIHILLIRRRIRRIDLHITVSGTFQQGIGVHHVRMNLDVMEVLCKCPLVPLALFEGVKNQHTFLGLRLSAYIERYLWDLVHIVTASARLDSAGQFLHRLLPHSVAQIVRSTCHQHRRHQTILPIVIVGKPPQRSLDSANDHRYIRIQFLQDLGIDSHSVIRPLSELPVRGIGIIVPEPLGSRIVVHHRIHGPCIDTEIKTRRTQLLEIPQVVAPVRLRHNSNAPAPFLKPTRYTCSSERRMVHESVTGKQDNVNVIPA